MLYGLLAEHTSDIILKTDRDGFILHASPAFESSGLHQPDMLIRPHLLDFVHPSCTEVVKAGHQAAIAGKEFGRWIEFSAVDTSGEDRWFAIQSRSLADDGGEVYGALSIMRSMEERRALEEKLFVAELTDPLTGLTNREAFKWMLRHLVKEGIDGCLALFAIDYFRAINMQYGYSAGDKALVTFADLLSSLMRPDDTVSRVGGESVAVLLPLVSLDEAQAICQPVINTLAQLHGDARGEGLSLTASAGVCPIMCSVDETINRAEMALFLARSKGRSRLQVDRGEPGTAAQPCEAEARVAAR